MSIARLFYPALGLGLIFGTWAIVSGAGMVGVDILPAPWTVVGAMIGKHASLLPELWITAKAVLLTIACTTAFGLLTGLLIVECDRLGTIVYPLLVGSQVIPKVAVGPVVLIVLGFGLASKVVIAFLIAFFPAVLGTVLGLRSVSAEKRALAKTMGASWWGTLIKIRIPAALPNFVSGLKLSMIYCVTGVVIAEFVGSDKGIGRVVLQASSVFNVETVFAATGYIVLLGIGVFWAANCLEAIVLWARGDASALDRIAGEGRAN